MNITGLSVDMRGLVIITQDKCNSSGISKLIWLEFDQNLSNAYIEKRLLDGQLGTGAGPNIAVPNQSVAHRDI